MLRRSCIPPSILLLLLTGCSDETEPERTFRPHYDLPVLEDLSSDPDVVEVRLTATHEHEWDFGDGRSSHGLAYNGHNPGPLLEAKLGDRIIVHFQNDLAGPTTVHWHGMRVHTSMDGSQLAQQPLPAGASFDYELVARDVGLQWYHPHMHESGQIDLGLYGPILIHDPAEPSAAELALDQPLVVDDVLLDDQGQIAGIDPHDPDLMDQYPNTVADGTERLGNAILVNGRIDPGVPVTRGTWVLFRLLNTSNARTMRLALEGHTLRVVGFDGGFLSEPYETDAVRVGVGERYLVLVQMNGEAGRSYHWINDRVQEDPFWTEPLPEGVLPIATVEYAAEEVPFTPAPAFPATDAQTLAPTSDVTHAWQLGDAFIDGDFVPTIDGEVWPNVPLLTYAANGDYTFLIENKDESRHPFHLHGNRFQVVQVDGEDVGPRGWKDTVLVEPDSSVMIRTVLDNPGDWMYHCHILAHQEEGMMAEMRVQ